MEIVALNVVIFTAVGLTIGSLISYIILKKVRSIEDKKLGNTKEEIIQRAKREHEDIVKEAKLESKEIIFRGRQELDKEVKEKKWEITQQEKRLLTKEETIDKKLDTVYKKEEFLDKKDKELDEKLKDIDVSKSKINELKNKYVEDVERVANMTREDAKNTLLEQMLSDAKMDSAKRIREIEEDLKQDADKRAKSIISTAIQRCAPDFVNDISVTVVNLPSDDMKGRIIGREGRNVRTFETITGVDIIVDDTPEAVILSSYDPYRRETAKLTLEKLIADGRIHPARIEELHEKSKLEMKKHILEIGGDVVFNLGLHGIHNDILELLGRLKYRTSYGQNVLAHSIEVATITGIMAAELGMDVKIAKRAGLLHDIGKAIDHDVEGSHTQIGVEYAKRCKEDSRVINAIASHHGEVEYNCIEAILVQSADAISASRPGARREVLESYIKRLEKLEEITLGFEGVQRSFAIQAGREVRIIVEPDKVNDDGIITLSRDISKKIEEEVVCPGQIKVLVIRESRAIEYAK